MTDLLKTWCALVLATTITLAGPVHAAPGIESVPRLETTLIVQSGDTLDALLARFGLETQMRAEAALAIQVEFDVRRIRPGNELTMTWTELPHRRPAVLALRVDAGVIIEVTFDGDTVARRIEPRTVVRDVAVRFTVEGSVYASLEAAEAPPRLAIDLAQHLGTVIDFQRDLQTGDRVELLWRERRVDNGDPVGPPDLRYARLEISGRVLELVRADDANDVTIVVENGEPVQTYVPPLRTNRISSVFGRRRHPIYGNVRMHTGVDFAAPAGTPVSATGPGEVVFVGRRAGYGRVVEIQHESGVMTRYAHLRSFDSSLNVGIRISAGDFVGTVGVSGTTTGPNLHYEVLLDGSPVDPLSVEQGTLIDDAVDDHLDHGDLQALRNAVELALSPEMPPG